MCNLKETSMVMEFGEYDGGHKKQYKRVNEKVENGREPK